MHETNEREIPERAIKWALDAVDPDAVLLSVRRLQGGISAVVHSLSLRTKRGVRQVVLRQFHNEEWLRQEPDLARHEAESLRRAALTEVLSPRVIAFDETGQSCGRPAVLVTQLEGSVVLRPDDMEAWVHGLAEALARIHAEPAGDFPWRYNSYNDPAAAQVPKWTRCPDIWREAVGILRGPRPQARICFIHRDYHPANVLWAGGQVSGVVDWVNACQGPAGIDVGHCRVNLAQLHGVEAADLFLDAFRTCAGSSFSYDPYWDLLSLADMLTEEPPSVYAGWTALGAADLTSGLLIERIDDYLVSLVARANGA